MIFYIYKTVIYQRQDWFLPLTSVQIKFRPETVDGFCPSGVSYVSGHSVMLWPDPCLLLLRIGIFPLGWRHFQLFSLLVCTPHFFTVFFHPLEVAVTYQLKKFLVPWLWRLRYTALHWTWHFVRYLLFIVFIEHFVYTFFLNYFQGDFPDSVNNAVFYCLTKVSPCIQPMQLQE